MNILDTDVLSHLLHDNAVADQIRARIDIADDPDFRITSVSVYELVGGAVDLIRGGGKHGVGPVKSHSLLQSIIEYLANWRGLIVPFDEAARQASRGFPAEVTRLLGKKGDARIAAVAKENSAAIWTLNVKHFSRVPGLVVYRADTGERVS